MPVWLALLAGHAHLCRVAFCSKVFFDFKVPVQTLAELSGRPICYHDLRHPHGNGSQIYGIACY